MDVVYLFLGVLLGLALAFALFRLARKGLALYVRGLLRHEYPGKDFIQQNRDIYTAIVEMRALTDSDRGYVIQFHNGSEFLLSNPVWKLTNTHEVVRPGVTYEANNVQNVLVSRIAEIIEPIISGDFSRDGIYKAPRYAGCDSDGKFIGSNRLCAVIQVAELPTGFSKFFLEAQNIKTIVECGLSNRHGAFGLVGCDVCGTAVTDPEDLAAICEQVCKTAERVQNSLEYKKPPSARVRKKSSK